jgi:hypothetical protein
VQRQLNDVPAVAYTEDSLCDVLTELGAARKDKAMLDEAIGACKDAVLIFKDNQLTGLAAGSETNLAEAQAALTALQ